MTIDTSGKLTVIVSNDVKLKDILFRIYRNYIRNTRETSLEIYPMRREEDIERIISISKKSRVVFIDQIEIGLTPNKQQDVIKTIQEGLINTKLIITTNSPIILTTVDNKCIRIISKIDDKLIYETPNIQTKGVSCDDVLSTIMNTHAIPQIEESKWVSDLHALITEGLHKTEEAVELMEKIVSHFGEDSSTYLEIKRCIRLSEMMR